MKKLSYPYNINDPDRLFDLIVYRSYCLGNFGGNIPVDEARQVFEKIKKLLKKKNERTN